jgi:hypothetical protein
MIYSQFSRLWVGWLLWLGCIAVALANSTVSEQVVTIERNALEDPVVYGLTTIHPQQVNVVFLAMPGGEGQLHLTQFNGQLKADLSDNFLLRAREQFVDSNTVYAFTSATSSPERLRVVLTDLKKRFPAAGIFLITTSRSTLDSMKLAPVLDSELAGVIHTAAFDSISTLDTRTFKTPHLLVHHVHDECPFTPLAGVKRNHDLYGTALIEVEGGVSQGDPCQSMSYHGFNGVEAMTIDKIKAWTRHSAQ